MFRVKDAGFAGFSDDLVFRALGFRVQGVVFRIIFFGGFWAVGV